VKSLKAKAPIVLSLSLGPTSLAGSPQHKGEGAFLSPELYWKAVELHLKSREINFDKIHLLANSAGAFNGMQMLRYQPEGLTVSSAVFFSLPNFYQGRFPPAPENAQTNDPQSYPLRGLFEPMLAQFSQDPLWNDIDFGLESNLSQISTQTRVLIQDGEYDALGYNQNNQALAQRAQQQGQQIYHYTIPATPHQGPYDIAQAVEFLFNHSKE
jgi:pimeloyl-ACP methyl ester carboxylesterase